MAEVCGRPRPLGVVGIVGDLVLAVRAVSESIEVLNKSLLEKYFFGAARPIAMVQSSSPPTVTDDHEEEDLSNRDFCPEQCAYSDQQMTMVTWKIDVLQAYEVSRPPKS